MSGQVNSPGSVVIVRDLYTAAALLACGIPLAQGSDPIAVRFSTQSVSPVFVFSGNDPDGLIDVAQCAAQCAARPLEFMQENPHHPISYALAALMQWADLVPKFKGATPLVALQPAGGGATIYVRAGSRKHSKMTERGWTPAEAAPVAAMERLCGLPPQPSEQPTEQTP